MSSDADMDELEGFNPTTPAAKLAAKSKRAAAAPKISSLNTSLNGAGPSKAKPTTIKKPRVNVPLPAEVEVIDTDGPEEIEAPVVPTKTKAKAKGKAKAESKPVETVDIVDSGDERAAATRRSRAQKSKAAAPPEPASDSRITALEREVQRLKTQLEQSLEREGDLHDAYEQFVQSKEAEEEAQQMLVAQLHSLLAAKDEKYSALEAEFERCRQTSLVPPGDPMFVHILTPEEAEKDRLQLQMKLDEAIATLDAKEARIMELEVEVGDLTQERDGEIQRANQLQKELKTYTSGQRSQEPAILVRGEGGQGPLHSAAVRMYEELTNLLITHVRKSPNALKPGEMNWTFDCVYTPRSVNDPYPALMSLHFAIERGWAYDDPDDPQSPIVLKDSYWYQDSSGIDRDDPSMGNVLGGSMSFSHEQLHAFGRELFSNLMERLEPSPDDGSQGDISMAAE